MGITRLAMRNAQFVLIILLILVIVSVRSFVNMQRSEDPEANFPVFRIVAVYPGTSPEDLETLVVDPLEEVISKISDIKDFRSDMRDGVASIRINASYDVDRDKKYEEFLREINLVRPSLPEGIALFDVEMIKPADRVNFKIFALTSDDLSYSVLHKTAEDLQDVLEEVDGVSFVDVDAVPDDEIKIQLDYERMAAQNISLGQVVTLLAANNMNVPGGDVNLGRLNYSIKSSGDYKDLEEIRNVIVSTNGRSIVKLHQIADVYIGPADALWKASFNKEKAVLVGVKLKSGYNILDVDKKVNVAVDAFEGTLPATIEMSTAFDQVPSVQHKINNFFVNLIQGVALVGIIILLSLGWRAAIIIIILIPVCIILSIAVLSSAGYGLQQISIASLVIALGLLVDNGIVVIENINQMLREGLPKRRAAIEGTEDVGMAIISSTVTTLLAFFPLTQLGDAPGVFLISLPLTVIFTLVISLILALIFTPLISNYLLKANRLKPTSGDRFFHLLAQKIYKPLLTWALKYGWVVVLIALVFTAFTISLSSKIGVSFFPTADKPLLLIDVNAPSGSSQDYTAESTAYVESILDSLDIVKDYTTSIGSSNPQIYYNRIPKTYNKSHGQVMVNLKEFDQTSFYETIGTLRDKFTDWPKAHITVEELKNGAPVQAPIEIRVVGDNIDQLKHLASQVEVILENTTDVINISNPLSRNRTELTIEMDKEKAGLLGIREIDFDRTIRASLNGLNISETILDDDETYSIIVSCMYDEQPSIEDFYKIYIANQQGANVPLNHIANIKFSAGATMFNHYNANRYVGVLASVSDLDKTIPKTLEVIEELDNINWPNGYKYTVGGEYQEQQSTFGSLGVILILAMIAIFAVLVLQFKSVLQPLIVFMAIPLAAGGSFVALYLTGWPFSFFAFVGLISLIGIVVNNSIILVDHINHLLSQSENQCTLSEAIIDGSIRRLKPILLTTLTTILGLMPLTMQATNQWSPLCWTIIGGMVSSTVLTLLVIPILYKWLTFKKPVEKEVE